MIPTIDPDLFALALGAVLVVAIAMLAIGVGLFAWHARHRQAADAGPLRVLPREGGRDE